MKNKYLKNIIPFFCAFREKHLSNNYSLLAVTVFVMVLIVGLFLVIERISDTAWAEKNGVNDAPTPLAFPLPTEINPNFLFQVDHCFLPIASIYGYDLRITSGFRGPEEQDQIYNQGRTVNGHIVTEAPAGKSIHNYGLAIDVVDRTREYDIDWLRLGKIAFYCGLEPGDEGDNAHFDHRDGLSVADFAAGRRPKLLTLPCAIMEQRALEKQALTSDDLKACGAPKF
jgi:peptidoglycan L-alanyl-D-glutamate endopeptidase CwlK